MHALYSPKHYRSAPLLLAATVAGLALLGNTARGAFSFNDSFSSSTLNTTAGVPTPGSTTYQIASTKNASSSIAAGHLIVNLPSTTSGVVEAQALFSSAPLTLATAGDFVEMTITFTDTGILLSGSSDTIYFGMYSSGGSAPLSGLQSSGLNTTAGSTFATGGTQLWQGYLANAGATNAKVFSRPQQTGAGTTSANQELLANGASGGTFNNPAGTQVSPTLSQATALTSATAYTEALKILLNADGSETISSNLYQGIDTTGTNLLTQSVTTSTTPVTTSFDGLAFGWRHSVSTGGATSMDVTSLTVMSNVTPAVPEPAALSLLALGGLTLLARRRRV